MAIQLGEFGRRHTLCAVTITTVWVINISTTSQRSLGSHCCFVGLVLFGVVRTPSVRSALLTKRRDLR